MPQAEPVNLFFPHSPRISQPPRPESSPTFNNIATTTTTASSPTIIDIPNPTTTTTTLSSQSSLASSINPSQSPFNTISRSRTVRFSIFLKRKCEEFFLSKFSEFDSETEKTYITQSWQGNLFISKILAILMIAHLLFTIIIR